MRYKSSILIWLILIFLYLSTRLINLSIIPIFTDEAIYTYWSQVALHDPANRFISLEDGKQPLFIWLAAILQSFISDPLIATRLVSVFAGFGSTIAIYLLSRLLFNQKVAFLASLLYILLPFTLLYDRLALFDSLLTMLGIYAIYFSAKLAKDSKLDLAIINGMTIGLATLTKSSGFFFLYFLPFSLLLSTFITQLGRLLKWITLAVVSIVFAQIVYNSLRLSPLFYIIARKNLEFIRPVGEVIGNPFAFFFSNSTTIISWFVSYLSLPLFLIFLGTVVYGYLKRNRQIIYLSILIIVSFLAEALFNKVLYPRFLLFYFPYMIILIAFAVSLILEKFVTYKKYLGLILILFLLLLQPMITSFKLLTDPQSAKIADSDAGQYFNGWPAGYGVAEIVKFLRMELFDQRVYIGTEGTFGLLPYAIQIYFYGDERVKIVGFWPIDANNLPAQVTEAAKKGKTFFVFNENQKEIDNSHLKLVAKYQKGRGKSFMRLYEVIP